MELRWTDVKQYVRGEKHEDEAEGADAWIDHRERRRATVRSCVCLLLCVLGTVATSVCFAMAGIAAMRPASRVQAVLEQVKQASVVDFSVTFKESSEVVHDTGVKRAWRRPRRAFYGHAVVKVSGALIPRTSEDSGRLRFDGWIHIETNASQRHEMTLANHRGYRTVRELPSLKIASEGCLTTDDILPLHAMEAVASSAFRAEELSAFGVNCSYGQAIEVVFMGVPFVHCFDRSAALPPELLPLSPKGVDEAAVRSGSTLVFHGEQVKVEAIVKAKEQVTLLSTGGSVGGDIGDLAETEKAERRHEREESVPAACMYLEAPLSSGREKRSLLYHLLPPR